MSRLGLVWWIVGIGRLVVVSELSIVVFMLSGVLFIFVMMGLCLLKLSW